MTLSDTQRVYRRNFALWVAETSLWMLATAFIDSTTVLPVLLAALSHSPFIASLTLSLRFAGQGWPQLIAASLVSGKPYRKMFFLWTVTPGRLLLIWPAVVLAAGIRDPAVVIPAIIIAYFGFWVSEGFSIVPWVDMVGKMIPSDRRGRLFAAMNVVGGILGIGAGVVIRLVLQHAGLPFPRGYGVLFVLALCFLGLSTLSLALMREPPSHPEEERYSTRALIKDIPNLLRSMPQFRLLVILQGLFSFALFPAPLYILFASRLLRAAMPGAVGEESVGVGFFLAVETAGMIAGNTLWGHLGDRYGNRLLLRVIAFLHVAVPLMALLAGMLARYPLPGWALYLAFTPTFLAFGSLLGGTWMAVTNFLLDLAPIHDRPAYIAVSNALNIPAVILPMLGGVLVDAVGFTTIFLTAALFLAYAVLLTGRLREPREKHIQHPPAPFDTWEE